MIIYKAKNKINGKVYIGKTIYSLIETREKISETLRKKWTNPEYREKMTKIRNSRIKKGKI